MRAISYHQMTALINQGQRMSNWLYNIAQLGRVPEDLRADAARMREAWDSLRNGDKFLLERRTPWNHRATRAKKG